MPSALRFAQARFVRYGGAQRCRCVSPRFSFGAYVQTLVVQSVAAERLVLVGPAVRQLHRRVPADTIAFTARRTTSCRSRNLRVARPQALPIVVFPGCGHFFHGRLPQLQATITGMWHEMWQGHARLPGA